MDITKAPLQKYHICLKKAWAKGRQAFIRRCGVYKPQEDHASVGLAALRLVFGSLSKTIFPKLRPSRLNAQGVLGTQKAMLDSCRSCLTSV